MPLVVLSPHLDDGVLSCGALLSCHPGSVVATTHAGRPRDDLPGQWDITCGFGTASEAMDARLAEDKRALAVLGATAEYCPALDSQYPSSATIRRQAQRNFIERVLDSYEAERLLLPLGLLHGDHIETRNAALAVLRSHGGRGTTWCFYTDLPYGPRFPESIETAQSEIGQLGYDVGPPRRDPISDLDKKLEAVNCYESQVDPLFGASGFHVEQIFEEERWLIVDRRA